MRRRKQPEVAPRFNCPLELARFVASEWPGETQLQAAGAWYEARDEWARLNGEEPDVDDLSLMPDAPFDASQI